MTHWPNNNGHVVTFKNWNRLTKWVKNENIDFLQLKIIRDCIQDKMDFMLYNNPFQAFQCKVKHKQMLKTFNLLNLPAERNPAVKNVQVRILCLGWSSNFFVNTQSKSKLNIHHIFHSASYISLYWVQNGKELHPSPILLKKLPEKGRY